ncbi:hypothetical protein CDL12_12799 [Handroanthus impetiginosus]|uniref:SMP domain-containing protein n=1 Tax=Handroanthus impetiginosus TaxID=429701 RepID=A0A2G9HAL8_9LAMI|nr:hypothetical protein CDL12_12799 [Handroanthus impetiginosus]
MSQEQPQRPEGIQYGDIFDVSGELASQPIAPQDAAAMQTAEKIVLGQNPKAGTAAVMQSAADVNELFGVVGHDDISNIVKDQGATVAEADIGGYRIIAEAIGGQKNRVLGRYGMPTEVNKDNPSANTDAITTLEATALSAGDKPIDESDAAAIQAAEVRATGLGHVVPGGVAAEAQSAAAHNLRTARDEDKTKLGDVLTDATAKLTDDKPVTREDAEGVIAAEFRNNPDMATHPGGVAASVVAAARLNKEK